MKSLFAVTVLCLAMVTISGCKTNSKFFGNHILIYSYEDREFGVDSNYQFADFYKDTLHWIAWTYVGGPFIFDSAHAEQIEGKYASYPPFASFSIKLTKVDNAIFMGYQRREDKFRSKKYSVILNDTVRNIKDLLAPCNVVSSKDYSLYQGDTIIKFNSKKLRCWKFEELYAHEKGIDVSGHYVKRIVYLEQKTLVPIRVENTWYKYREEGLGDMDGVPFIYKLGYVIKRDSLARWLPRACAY